MAQIFPKWSNTLAKALPGVLLVLVVFIVFVFWYWCSPLNLYVGYRPEQPIPFSHKLHAGDLGVDCLYCHGNAERSAFAGVPSTQTCLNCHQQQASKDTFKMAGLMASSNSGLSIPWVRVHKVPDYAYFDHSAHVAVGVGCVSCHGRVDQMATVRVVKPLSMEWCLSCHRDPAGSLRPTDQVTNMNYHQSDEFMEIAKAKALGMNAPTNCSGCHR